MTIRQFPFALDKPAQKWRALAERRQAHFVELYKSGRWKHYYTDEEFVASMRDAIVAAKRWADIAPRATDFLQAAE